MVGRRGGERKREEAGTLLEQVACGKGGGGGGSFSCESGEEAGNSDHEASFGHAHSQTLGPK